MNDLLQQATEVAVRAGEEILSVYDGEFNVEIKGDGSPLILADQRSHALIAAGLAAVDPEIPMLSEESGEEAFRERFNWSRYWLYGTCPVGLAAIALAISGGMGAQYAGILAAIFGLST